MTRDRQSPGMVDLDGWVALGAENLVRVQVCGGDVPRRAVGHGSNSEVGPKPEGGHRKVRENLVPPRRRPRGGQNHEAGAAEPIGR
jgi:hypothetical protein